MFAVWKVIFLILIKKWKLFETFQGATPRPQTRLKHIFPPVRMDIDVETSNFEKKTSTYSSKDKVSMQVDT